MNNRKLLVMKILYIFALLFLVILAISCEEHTDEEIAYQTFYSQSPNPSISFEIPKDYNTKYFPYTETYLSVEITADDDSVDPMIHVDADLASNWEKLGLTTPVSILENHLSDIENLESVDNFTVIEHKEYEINGLLAQYAECSYNDNDDKSCEIYTVFRNDEFIWVVYAVYDCTEDDEVSEIYHHILDTIKILD